MSEQLPVRSPEAAAESQHHAELEAIRKRLEAAAEGSPTPEQQSQAVEVLRDRAEAAAQPAERLALPVDGTPDGNRPLYIDREVKALGLRRSLHSIQSKLPAPERALSRVIHQPAVRAVSEATGKTITRPSGLLGGGLCAFLGGSIYLYLAHHIGFAYNYLLFILLFVGGFALGVALELLLHFAHRRVVSDQ